MKITARWTPIETQGMLPLPRSSHDMSVVNDTLYLWGGEHVARTPIDQLMYRLDFEADHFVWRVVEYSDPESQNIPTARIAHAQAVVGDFIYIFGGRLGIGMSEQPLNDLYRFSTVDGTWEKIDSPGAPSKRSFHKMVSQGEFLYVFGGCGAEGRLNDLYRFDTVQKEWIQLPSFDAIKGRGGPSISVSEDGEVLLVATGFTGQENDDIYKLDLLTNEWSVVAESGSGLFIPRSVCGFATIDDIFVIYGGEVSTSNRGHEGAGDFTSNLVLIDANSGEVLEYDIGDMIPAPPRGWTSLASGSDKVFLFGGLAGDDENPVRLGDTYVLTLERN
eukprot:TRINITY_DN1997_c0_g1_i1.p1 TRINITY_DN1997_c0_g1~~TRINITY_DN1997_c0_g1_i1.p1  ORF type:complete len:332 (+),score=83.86 TRINITY_DN1997_c0_g1_i1:200-1195(+)